MPTINQLIKKGRETEANKSKCPILDACPQKARRLPFRHDDFSQEAQLGAS